MRRGRRVPFVIDPNGGFSISGGSFGDEGDILSLAPRGAEGIAGENGGDLDRETMYDRLPAGGKPTAIGMYFKEMGKVDLLTKEDEICFGKAIDVAFAAIVREIVFFPVFQSAIKSFRVDSRRNPYRGSGEEIFISSDGSEIRQKPTVRQAQDILEKVIRLFDQPTDRGRKNGGFCMDPERGEAIVEHLLLYRFNRRILKKIADEIVAGTSDVRSHHEFLCGKNGHNGIASFFFEGEWSEEDDSLNFELARKGLRPRERMHSILVRRVRQGAMKFAMPAREILQRTQRIRAALESMRALEKEFVAANLRLVISMAKRYSWIKSLDLSDIIQEGNFGLMKAVERFDYRRGYKFSTCATPWIKQAITRALADKGMLIRIPYHVFEERIHVFRTKQALTDELGHVPDVEEIAEYAEMPVHKVMRHIFANEPVSLDKPVGDDDSVLSDFVEDESAESPYELVETEEKAERAEEILSELSPKEQTILRMRFGLDGEDPMTLEVVGQRFRVTRERIRQIETKALNRLRNPIRAKLLRELI